MYRKDTAVWEEHWQANYPKVIYYRKEQPRPGDPTFLKFMKSRG